MQKVEAFRSGMSIFTSRAVDALKGGKPGDTLTLAQMASIVGRDCSHGTSGAGNVASAINHVHSNAGIVWRWSRASKAWRCLNPSEVIIAEREHLARGRKQNRKVLKLAAAVDTSGLAKDDLQQHLLTTTQAAMAEQMAGSSMMKKLAAKVNGDVPKIPELDKVLELMT